MLKIDFHSHTFFSNCGIHTHIEMLSHAKKLGVKALAITDHGPALNPKIVPPFFDRLQNPVDKIRMIKGMECNFLDTNGNIDLFQIQPRLIKHLELILIGLHYPIEPNDNIAYNTKIILKAIEKNHCIDIITHLHTPEYKVDFKEIAKAAVKNGIALELNNSKLLYQRTTKELTIKFLETCANENCKIVIGSDAHAIHELALDNMVRPILKEINFPEELILNDNYDEAIKFVENRKLFKKFE